MRSAAEKLGIANRVESDFKSIGLTCLCCGQPVRPQVLDYLPRYGTFKQFG
jgi:hypothetical protein